MKQTHKIQTGSIKSAIDISPNDTKIKDFIFDNINNFSFQNLVDIGIKYYNKNEYENAINILTQAETSSEKESDKKMARTWIGNCERKMNEKLLD